MRGRLNVIAASGGKVQAAAGDSADVGQTASVLPIPVPLGNATVTVAGGSTPTNAIITLSQAVPGVVPEGLANGIYLLGSDQANLPGYPRKRARSAARLQRTPTG